MEMSDEYTTGSYRIELLKADNWMPWKRRMLAVFRDLGLDKYIEKDAKAPESADVTKPTTEELEAQKKWADGDSKARTRIELSIGNAEMIHISGAITARQMWDQLCMVKESKGRLGVLATRHALYRATAEEGFDMIEHISKLRKLQEELHIMNNLVSDEDFVMILITSLPESWDNYTSSYLGSSGNKPDLKSHELVAILIEEDRRRKGRTGESQGYTLQARGTGKGNFKGASKYNSSETECYNCHKKGHMAKDCWAKGGGQEGQGPKGRKGPNRAGRAHQAREDTLNDVSYMASHNNSHQISQYDWVLDSATTSHICTIRDAFTDYTSLKNSTIQGLGSDPVTAHGRGTILVDFAVNGETIRHQLRDVLHVPGAPNCLLSVPRIDEAQGHVEFSNGECTLKDKKGNTIGKGSLFDRLYILKARAQLTSQEKANYASPEKLSWDQWHRIFGHIAISSLEQLDRDKMVDGMAVDHASIPS